MKIIPLAILLLSTARCGSDLQPGTEAEQFAAAGDSTSCVATRSPTGCGPAIACAGALAACLGAGCQIQGMTLVLYPDGSWRQPDPGAGTWAVTTDDRTGYPVLHLNALQPDAQSFLVADYGQPASDFACQ